MKHLAITLFLFCAIGINLFAQYNDPCYGLTEGLREVQKEVDKGNYEMALKMLENMKKDKSLQNCSEMKSGFVDYRINEVKKKMEENKPQPQQPAVAASLPSYKSCPDNSHPHLIDLGLPSGMKWACCNVGANKPEDYGGYYAWGRQR